MRIPGFEPAGCTPVQWWDPYASDPAQQILKEELVVSQPDGSLAIAVKDLARDVALKVFEVQTTLLAVVLERMQR